MSIENPTLAHFRHFSSLFTKFPSTLVENPLQISSFMQNKPNFQKSQMNLSIFSAKDYENKHDWTIGQSKPNSNPIKANLSQFQCQTKPNKPKTKPIQTQFQTGRPLMENRSYKLYLTLPLESDRIRGGTGIIFCNRNNEKGFQTCLLAILKKSPLQ